MIAIIYLIVPVYMVLLFILSWDEKLPPELSGSGIAGRFKKVAAYIYRKFIIDSRLFKGGATRRKVQENLKILDFDKNTGQQLKKYYVEKTNVQNICYYYFDLLFPHYACDFEQNS